MGLFERHLTLWVVLCIAMGTLLGHVLPGAFAVLASAEVAKVNLPVAVLIWLMIIPMLLKVDFRAMRQLQQHWKGIGVTLFINWAVKPFSMALLGWLFLRHAFADWLPAAQIDSYIAVPILIQVYFTSGLAYLLNRRLGVAHCVAGPSALIGASNFFELAVATAVGLFGVHSGAALATVVGVLIEVPVMLSVVRIVNRTQAWYERPQER